MAIILNDNIKISAGKPAESKYLNTSNLSYTDVNEVITQIPISERHVGLTVKIGSVEYWFKDSVQDIDLIVKTPDIPDLSANNGLVTIDSSVQLGGFLIKDTSIFLNNKELLIKSTGIYFNSFGGFNSNILDIVTQIDNKILIGGAFYEYSGYTALGLIRFNPDSTIDYSFDTTNAINIGGDIRSICIQSNGKILIGGNFNLYNSLNAYNIISLNDDATIDSSFNVGNGFNSPPDKLKLDSNGKILACGNFTFYNGTPVNNIIRLNQDGTIDNSFSTGSGLSGTGNIYAIYIQPNGKILIGGDFSKYNGVNVASIIRLNIDGTLDNSFNYIYNIDTINDINIQSNGKILLAGTILNGTPYNIISLNDDGTKDSSFNSGIGFNTSTICLYIQPNGKILVGGSFASYNGALSYSLIRLNEDSTIDSTFKPGGDYGFRESGGSAFLSLITISNNKILCVGQFDSYDSVPAHTLVRLNENGFIDNTNIIPYLTLNESGLQYSDDFSKSYTYRSLIDQEYVINSINNNKIIIDASFAQMNDQLTTYANNGLTKTVNNEFELGGNLIKDTVLNLQNNLIGINNYDFGFNFGDGFDGDVLSLKILNDGKLLVGGNFTHYNGQPYNKLIRLNKFGQIDTTFNIGSGFNGIINSVIEDNSLQYLIGGDFTTYNGVGQSRLIRLNPDGTKDTTFNIGSGFTGGSVTEIIQDASSKYLVGGSYSYYNASSQNGLIRLNLDGTKDTTFDIGSGFSPVDVRVVIQDASGQLLVGGGFTTFNGLTQNRLIRLNQDGTKDTTFDISTGFNQPMNDIALYSDGTILVGGVADTYKGIPGRRLFKIDNYGNQDYTFGMIYGFQDTIERIIIQPDNKIIVIGNMLFYDTSTAYKIIRLNANGSKDESFVFGTGFNARAYALDLNNNELIVGGTFTTYNSITSNKIVSIAVGSIFQNDGEISNIGNSYNLLNFDDDVYYGEDFSKTYKDRSLVDKEFVMNHNTPSNGLQTFNNNIELGGDLSKHTNININAASLNYINEPSIFNTGNGIQAGANYINTIAEHLNGNILLGGWYYKYNDVSVSNSIIALNPNGTLNTSYLFNKGITIAGSPAISQITVLKNNKILCTGSLDGFNDLASPGLLMLNADGSRDNLFSIGISGYNNYTTHVDIFDNDEIIVTGQYTTYKGLSSNRISVLDKYGYISKTFIVGTGFSGGQTSGVKIQSDQKVLIGGTFTSYRGAPVNGICRLTKDGSIDYTFNTGGLGTTGNVNNISINNNTIYLYGQILSFNGDSNVKGIIPLTYNGSLDVSIYNKFGTGLYFNLNTQKINKIHFYENGKILIGGKFNVYKDISINGNLVRLNDNGDIDYTFDISTGFTGGNYGEVYDFLVKTTGEIIVVGEFTKFMDISIGGIVTLDSTGKLFTTPYNSKVSISNNALIKYGGNYNDLFDKYTLIDKNYSDLINNAQDISINLIRNINNVQDVSILELINKNIVYDLSINDLYQSSLNLDSSINLISSNNTGDQIGDGITITGTGKIGDPFVSVSGIGGISEALAIAYSIAL